MKLDKITQCLIDKYAIQENESDDEKRKRAQEEERKRVAIRSAVATKFLRGDYNKK